MILTGIGDEAGAKLDAQINASKELGWKPQHAELEQIISSAWAWHQKHPNGYSS